MRRLLTLAALLAVPAIALATPLAAGLLPTGWRVMPATDVLTLGTLPQGATLSRDGSRLFVLESGFDAPAVRVIDPAALRVVATAPLKGAFGRPVLDTAGTGVWIATGNEHGIAHVTADGAVDRTIPIDGADYTTGLDLSRDGSTFVAASDVNGTVHVVDAKSGAIRQTVKTGGHPANVAISGDGKTAYVALWADRSVAAIEIASGTMRKIGVGLHPEALALGADGTRLYVANADDDTISAIDTTANTVVATWNVPSPGFTQVGASPNALRLAADGRRLFVTCGAANSVAVLDLTNGRVTGTIPAGWYPTDVVERGNELLILDGKGETNRANPGFRVNARDVSGYVAHLETGAMRRVAVASGLAPLPNPTPFTGTNAVIRPNGPIKHVIYVIKENRTYDQVLGDIGGADGDPGLVMFGKDVTPNQHAIVARFGVLDRAFTDAEVSANGHNWSTAAFANDYLEKMWPPNYGGRRELYDFEDGATASVPHSGYLWDAIARANLTMRNYGEFVVFGAKPGEPAKSTMPHLDNVTDPGYRGFDLSTSDLTREAEWAREFDGYVKNRNLPQLEILRLGNDHTSGTAPGKLTPRAYVAQNDEAFGRLVDRVSHTRYWRDTLILSVEDDAQNGADHVSDQRSTFYVASAYAKPGIVHTMITTASVVRTIETVLGLPPMTPYDAAAAPITEPFHGTPDFRPFNVLRARVDLNEKNTAQSYRARDAQKLDFTHADDADPAILNDILRGDARQRGIALR